MKYEKIVLKGWVEGAHKVRTIKLIRQIGNLGLAPAKELIDRCLAGEEVYIHVKGNVIIHEAVKRLTEYGFIVQVGEKLYHPSVEKLQPRYQEPVTGIFVPVQIFQCLGDHTFQIAGLLQSGKVNEGDQLAIPIHEAFTIIDVIESISKQGEQIVLKLQHSDEEAFALWNEMEVLNMELPVFSNIDH